MPTIDEGESALYAALGVAAAVAAGTSFAGAGVLQQRAAARTRDRSALSVGLVTSLARQPMWLAGVCLAAASYGLQALALSAQPLSVVQPLLVTELLVAIPISAGLAGHRLRGREWAGLLTLAGGLAATVWGASPRHGGGTAQHGSPLRWLLLGGGLVALTALLALLARHRSPLAQARLYAAAAALVLALSAAFLAVTVSGFATHGLRTLATPAPYGMAVAEIVGMVFIQSAFQAGSLAVSMPIVNWVQPMVAVLLGIGVLGEAVATGPAHLCALAVGALTALGGILILDTSPCVQAADEPASSGPRAGTVGRSRSLRRRPTGKPARPASGTTGCRAGAVHRMPAGRAGLHPLGPRGARGCPRVRSTGRHAAPTGSPLTGCRGGAGR